MFVYLCLYAQDEIWLGDCLVKEGINLAHLIESNISLDFSEIIHEDKDISERINDVLLPAFSVAEN